MPRYFRKNMKRPQEQLKCMVVPLPDQRPSPPTDITALQDSFKKWAMKRGVEVIYAPDAPCISVQSSGSRAMPIPNALNVFVSMTEPQTDTTTPFVRKSSATTVDDNCIETHDAFEDIFCFLEARNATLAVHSHAPALSGSTDRHPRTTFSTPLTFEQRVPVALQRRPQEQLKCM